MTFQEKTLQCLDCGNAFAFSIVEQEFFASKGYTNVPKRCPACREARKTKRTGNEGYNGNAQREMYPVVCAECGKDTRVPFQPRAGRPVYCSDCYNKVRLSR